MQNFENLIRAAIADGNSTEAIAKVVNEALNRIEQEEAEKKKLANSREAYCADMLDAFHDRYNEYIDDCIKTLEYSDIASLATVIFAEKFPDCGKEPLKAYHASVEKNLVTLEKIFTGNFDKLFDGLFKAMLPNSRKDERDSAARSIAKFLVENGLN